MRGGPGSKSTPEAPVGAVNKKPATSKHANPHSPNRKRDPKGTCSRCGKFPPHDRQHCVARDAVCCKCGKSGHFQSVCRSSVTIRGVQASHPPSSEENFLGVVTSTNTTNDNPWIVTLQMNSIPVQFHIDTGAEVTVINDTVYKKVGSPSLSQSDQTLRGPSNQSLPVKGKFLAQFQYSGVTTEHNCYVVTDLSRPLLGRPAIEQLKLLARVQAVQEISSPRDIVSNTEVFQIVYRIGKATRTVSHQIDRWSQAIFTQCTKKSSSPIDACSQTGAKAYGTTWSNC